MEECVIDTVVLQSANAPITKPPRRGSLFAKRVRLLEDVRVGNKTVLYSPRLVQEYQTKISEPRNDYVKAFLEILSDPRRSIPNWKRWTGSQQDRAHSKCRYPSHDDHLLQTAIRPNPTMIITEEATLLSTDTCIHRYFGVHIRHVAALY
jgi:predicted nucleic acid-binding protein